MSIAVQPDTQIINVNDLSLAQAALYYAERGIYVFPLKPGTKEPLTRNGQDDSTKDPAVVAAWWAATPMANIGVHGEPSGLFLVDLDMHDPAKDGPVNWARWCSERQVVIPSTWAVNTPSGGRHLYFAVPEGISPRANSAGKLVKGGPALPGVDTRANGYVVAAPSVLPGGRYSAVCLAAPVPMPPELVAATDPPPPPAPRDPNRPLVLAASADVTARVLQLAAELHDAPVGEGNNTAARVAFMVGQYVGADQLAHEEALDVLADAIGDWGYANWADAGRMFRTIDRQLVEGARSPRAWEATRSAFVPDVLDLNAPAAAEGGYGRTADEVATELLAIDDQDARAVRVREIALEILAAVPDAPGRQLWRAVLRDHGGLSFGDFAQLASWYAKEDKRLSKLAASIALMATEGVRELAEPDDPTAVVAQLVESIPRTGDTSHWAWWKGDFYRWTGAHHEVFPDPEVRQWLYRQTENAVYTTPEVMGMPGTTLRWKPDKAKIDKLKDALSTNTLQRVGEADRDVIACTNAVLDISGPVWTVHPHEPGRFNLYSQPYELDDQAQCPQWLAFLAEVLPDADQRDLLGEWFGYVLSGRTDQQKMLSLVGPPRSGKGTIGRVLEALLGSESVAAPQLGALAGNFGRESLIGKRLALLGDVRWKGRETQEATPILLGIVGGDLVTIPRKNKIDWYGKPDVRFMLMSNDAPSFSDASGALASRFLHLEMTRSWLGSEDLGLEDRLKTELPGILNWALWGLRRLLAGGRFTVPASSARLAEEVLVHSSPITAFVDQRCTLGEDKATMLDEAYEVWRNWCASEGRSWVGTKADFSRDLRSAFRGRISSERVRVKNALSATVQVTRLQGVCLAVPDKVPMFTESK